MFTTTAFLEVENQYRREALRRAWGGRTLLRLRRHHWASVTRHAHRPAHSAASVAHEHVVAGAR